MATIKDEQPKTINMSELTNESANEIKSALSGGMAEFCKYVEERNLEIGGMALLVECNQILISSGRKVISVHKNEPVRSATAVAAMIKNAFGDRAIEIIELAAQILQKSARTSKEKQDGNLH